MSTTTPQDRFAAPRIDGFTANLTPEMFLGYTISGDLATISREHEDGLSMHAKDGVVWVLLGVDGESHQVVVEAGNELEAMDAAIWVLTAARDHLRALTGA